MRQSHTALRIFAFLFRIVNRVVVWHKIPFIRLLGALNPRVLNLPALRYDLRRWNLHDTAQLPGTPLQNPGPFAEADRSERRADGTHNDLRDPMMGCAGSRFGRNLPLDQAWPEPPDKFLDPSPREISRILMTRYHFIPATSLNMLAAAWIQFQVHDWFSHKQLAGQKDDEFIKIKLKDGDDWHQDPMKIRRTEPDPTRPRGCTAGPPTFINYETHWWDSSQLYGSSSKIQKLVRSSRGGKLKIENGFLPLMTSIDPETNQPIDPALTGVDLTGFNDNWWVGLSLLHTLFAHEHNAICDRLREEYPAWDDNRLFQTARLINTALMAKIHTVEWTPGILGHPALQIGMNANWWGAFGERIHKLVGRLGESEELWGIPGSPTDHHAAPYYLTEEFVAVYRLHPLIPDDYRFQSLSDPAFSTYKTFTEIQGNGTRQVITEAGGMANALYSFGLAHPGAITLGNFPRFLQKFERIKPLPNGERDIIDLAAVDIVRDRERGVPRYNRFRRMLRMKPVSTFEELNPDWAKPMADLYKNDIERVDSVVGLLAELPPKGFGFSDTAFRIFILMASRRLKSDRFFTSDYRPEVYTKVGLDWVNDNTMTSVLLRHYPALAPALAGIPNAFMPWNNVFEPLRY